MPGLRAHEEIRMKYMLLIYGDEAVWAEMSEAEMREVIAAHAAYGEAMEQAGVLRGGAELKPGATATTLRFANGKSVLTDGPFAETREQLGGYYLIETDTFDEALAWAAKMPAMSSGAVEVRPLGEGG
jgi:hypothetical protein